MLGFIGSYFVKLDGQVDGLVFAGGIGEKSAFLRKTLVEKSRSLGFAIDESKNDQGPKDDQTVLDISKGSASGRKVLVCQTNEQVSFFFFSFFRLCVISFKMMLLIVNSLIWRTIAL